MREKMVARARLCRLACPRTCSLDSFKNIYLGRGGGPMNKGGVARYMLILIVRIKN